MSDTPVWDINKWLADALQPLGMSATEEPMRKNQEGSSYITWQQGTVRNKSASGCIWAQSAQVSVWLWALDNCDWQTVRQSIINALMAAGAKSASAGTESWIPEISRRQVTVVVLLQRGLA